MSAFPAQYAHAVTFSFGSSPAMAEDMELVCERFRLVEVLPRD